MGERILTDDIQGVYLVPRGDLADSKYDVWVEMRPRRLKWRARRALLEMQSITGGMPWMAQFVGMQLETNRRQSAVVERVAFLDDYLILRPSDLAVRLLYGRLERHGA